MLRFCRWINVCLHLVACGIREFLVFRGKVGETASAESCVGRALLGIIVGSHCLLWVTEQAGKKTRALGRNFHVENTSQDSGKAPLSLSPKPQRFASRVENYC